MLLHIHIFQKLPAPTFSTTLTFWLSSRCYSDCILNNQSWVIFHSKQRINKACDLCWVHQSTSVYPIPGRLDCLIKVFIKRQPLFFKVLAARQIPIFLPKLSFHQLAWFYMADCDKLTSKWDSGVFTRVWSRSDTLPTALYEHVR